MGPWRLAQLAAAGTLLAAIIWAWRSDGRRRYAWPDVAVGWWLWHWFTGATLEPRTVFHSGDRGPYIARRVLVGTGRTVLAGSVVASEYVRSGAPWGTKPLTVLAVGAGGAVSGAVGCWVMFFLAVQVVIYRRWIRSLHLALFQTAGWPEHKIAYSWLTIPRDRAEGRNGVIVKLPPKFDVRSKSVEKVVEIVCTRLDLRDVTPVPVLHRAHGYVKFQPREKMPDRAMFADPKIRELLETAKSSAPVIGVTTGAKPVAIDLDTESPHVLFSAGTGGGKSTMTRTIVAQLMRDGASVTVIDLKRHSHQWLRRLPGVTYARDLGDIHHALVDIAQEGHRRNALWDDVDIDEQGPVFTRHVVLFEEINATMGALRDWWKSYRESGDPQVSPALRSLGQILFMGRAVRIHVLTVAQMGSAKDMGGAEFRENYTARVLARYSPNAAKMLAPDYNLPPATRHPGRAQVCIGGTAIETQAVFMSMREARDFVAERRGLASPSRAVDVADVASRTIARTQGERPVTVARDLRSGVEPITLVEASADRGIGVVTLRYDALRKAIERAPAGERPPIVGRRGAADLYLPHDVQRFENNRPLARAVGTGDTGNEVDEVDRMGTRNEI